MTTSEQEAKARIDALLQFAGWSVQYASQGDIHAAGGVAIRKFQVEPGLRDGRRPALRRRQGGGCHRGEKAGFTLSDVETLAHLMDVGRVKRSGTDHEIGGKPTIYAAGGSFLSRLRHMPPLVEEGLWPAPIKAIGNLQQSLKEDRLCARRAWQLDDDFEYGPEELDRRAQTPDQIRTIDRTLRDRRKSDLFPQRQELPKTLVFAKDDNHAEAIVGILRKEWGRGNEFAQKITYRTTGAKPEELIKAFRTSYGPRVAVTAGELGFREHPEDVRAGERAGRPRPAPGFRRCSAAPKVIATGTDIKPVAIVVFMRSVKSRSIFEQMKGCGVRVMKDDDLRGVSRPMDQKKVMPLEASLRAESLVA